VRHLGVGLEAARGQHDVARGDRAGAAAVPHAHALHAVVVGDETHGPGVVEHRDAVLLAAAVSEATRPGPPPWLSMVRPPPELEPAIDLERLPAPDGREAHALAPHPAQRVAALLDQHLDQFRIGAILR
jgi:hypothetical protein